MQNDHPALPGIMDRISQAALRSGRKEQAITLVAVSKKKPIEAIVAAYEAGVRHFGENRAEELEEKAKALQDLHELKWHFIGNLQTRQSGIIARHAHYFHAIDRLKIAQRLSRQLTELNRNLSVFIQVNVSGEVSKSGFPCDQWQQQPEQSEALIQICKEVAGLPGLNFLGLMTMAPFDAPEDTYREIFRTMAALSSYMGEQVPDLSAPHLSMGMSGDFEIAIEEGATYVRIGTAVFGPRE